MAFNIYTFKEEERRTYTLTMWPRQGEKITPKAGIVDCENNIRLFYYGNGPYREASKEYQFIFDYKGIVMNVNIGVKIEDNDVYYSLIEIERDNEIKIEDIKVSLREAIRFYGVNKYCSHRKDNAVVINTVF